MSLVSGIYNRGTVGSAADLKISSNRVNSFKNHEREIMRLEPQQMISWKKNTFKEANNFRSCLWHGLRSAGVLNTRFRTQTDIETFTVYVIDIRPKVETKEEETA